MQLWLTWGGARPIRAGPRTDPTHFFGEILNPRLVFGRVLSTARLAHDYLGASWPIRARFIGPRKMLALVGIIRETINTGTDITVGDLLSLLSLSLCFPSIFHFFLDFRIFGGMHLFSLCECFCLVSMSLNEMLIILTLVCD